MLKIKKGSKKGRKESWVKINTSQTLCLGNSGEQTSRHRPSPLWFPPPGVHAFMESPPLGTLVAPWGKRGRIWRKFWPPLTDLDFYLGSIFSLLLSGIVTILQNLNLPTYKMQELFQHSHSIQETRALPTPERLIVRKFRSRTYLFPVDSVADEMT